MANFFRVFFSLFSDGGDFGGGDVQDGGIWG